MQSQGHWRVQPTVQRLRNSAQNQRFRPSQVGLSLGRYRQLVKHQLRSTTSSQNVKSLVSSTIPPHRNLKLTTTSLIRVVGQFDFHRVMPQSGRVSFCRPSYLRVFSAGIGDENCWQRYQRPVAGEYHDLGLHPGKPFRPEDAEDWDFGLLA